MAITTLCAWRGVFIFLKSQHVYHFLFFRGALFLLCLENKFSPNFCENSGGIWKKPRINCSDGSEGSRAAVCTAPAQGQGLSPGRKNGLCGKLKLEQNTSNTWTNANYFPMQSKQDVRAGETVGAPVASLARSSLGKELCFRFRAVRPGPFSSRPRAA